MNVGRRAEGSLRPGRSGRRTVAVVAPVPEPGTLVLLSVAAILARQQLGGGRKGTEYRELRTEYLSTGY